MGPRVLHSRRRDLYKATTQYDTIHLTIIPRTRVGYELFDSGRGAKPYPISVSGIIVLLNTKHWIRIS